MIEETFEEIKLSGELPSPSGVGMRILQLTRTDDYETEEIGQVIMTDSSLTGQILRVANSAANASVEPATTVTEAIMRLGSSSVRDLALAFSLVSDRSVGSCKAFDYEGYWSRSLARAVAAQRLSQQSNVGKPEEAYICGLLGEIGQLALASVFPDRYTGLISSGVTLDTLSRLDAETKLFKINSAQVASCMLREWGLPDTFSEAIEALASSPVIGARESRFDGLATLLRYADLVARAMCLPARLPESCWVELEKGLEKLGSLEPVFEPGDLQPFFDACVTDWVNWGNSLKIETDKNIRFETVLERIEEGKALGLEAVEPTGVVTAPEGAATPDAGSQAPVESGGAAAAAPAGSPKVEEAEGQLRLLVVEDEPAISSRLEAAEIVDGLSVSAAPIEDGLARALESDPDILVCRDNAQHDGLELCRLLRNSRVGKSLYFLLMADDLDEDFVVRAFEDGIDDLVPEDCPGRLLTARIRGGIRLAQLQRRAEEDRRTVRKQISELGILTRRLRSAALTDALTELPNRRYAMKRLDTEWSSTSRTGRPLSVMLIDIDHFKAVNDTYGHDVGDVVLKDVAGLLRSSLRQSDEVCRIGGEEFLVICKNTTQSECVLIGERIRRSVEACDIESNGDVLKMTISLGAAGRSSSIADINALLKAADEAVYQAKETGRNKVCQAPKDRPAKSA